MSEQRLIDAVALSGVEKILDNDAVKDVPAAYWVMKNVLKRIDETPTIDPETLPIVKELRAQLARVTAERDAAVKDLYAVKACKTCALQFSDDCLLEECFEPCGATLSENTPYKWRGIQEAKDDE